MKSLKQLKCRISEKAIDDAFLGKFVGLVMTVKGINKACCGGFVVNGVLEEGTKINLAYSEDLIPLDTSDVPSTHNTSQLLINVWVFVTAYNDAWTRDQQPPESQDWENWNDTRTYDVKRKSA